MRFEPIALFILLVNYNGIKTLALLPRNPKLYKWHKLKQIVIVFYHFNIKVIKSCIYIFFDTIMDLVLTGGLVVASSFSSYYIYAYHSQHFKETIFLKGMEFASKSKSKIKTYKKYLPESLIESTSFNKTISPIQIIELKIIRPDGIIDFDPDYYDYLDWSTLDRKSLIHVVYLFQNKNYRIIFSFGHNLKILSTDLNWLQDGFLNAIEELETNLTSDQVLSLMEQYAGPLCDFYASAKINQNSDGFLLTNSTDFLMQSDLVLNQYNPYIEITDIMGDDIIFGEKIST